MPISSSSFWPIWMDGWFSSYSILLVRVLNFQVNLANTWHKCTKYWLILLLKRHLWYRKLNNLRTNKDIFLKFSGYSFHALSPKRWRGEGYGSRTNHITPTFHEDHAVTSKIFKFFQKFFLAVRTDFKAYQKRGVPFSSLKDQPI